MVSLVNVGCQLKAWQLRRQCRNFQGGYMKHLVGAHTFGMLLVLMYEFMSITSLLHHQTPLLLLASTFFPVLPDLSLCAPEANNTNWQNERNINSVGSAKTEAQHVLCDSMYKESEFHNQIWNAANHCKQSRVCVRTNIILTCMAGGEMDDLHDVLSVCIV